MIENHQKQPFAKWLTEGLCGGGPNAGLQFVKSWAAFCKMHACSFEKDARHFLQMMKKFLF